MSPVLSSNTEFISLLLKSCPDSLGGGDESTKRAKYWVFKFSFFVSRFMHISTNTLALTSIEKMITVYFPLRARDICTPKGAYKVCGFIVTVLFIYEAQAFFTISFDSAHGRLACIAISDSYLEFYEITDSLLYSYFPLTVLFLCNIAIIIKLLVSKYKSGENEASGTSLSKAAVNITVMLVSACILFIVCTMPYAVLYQVKIDVSTYSYAAFILLMYTNHSVNIIVYWFTNSQFRREVLRLFCCARTNQVHSITGSSLASSAQRKWVVGAE